MAPVTGIMIWVNTNHENLETWLLCDLSDTLSLPWLGCPELSWSNPSQTVSVTSLWKFGCSRTRRVGVLQSASSEHIYPFWSLISLEHASGFLNSCIAFVNEDLFAQRICRKDLASRRQSMMAVGKRLFGFQRFKECWCSFATRANAHCLDQNWQALADKVQHSDHWAKNANLKFQNVNHCDYKVWLQKKFTTRKTCWITVWLLAYSCAESHNEDMTWEL